MKINPANAFALPPAPELGREDELFVRRTAARLRAKGLRQPAFLAVESARPLHFLGFSAALFLRPFAELVYGPDRAGRFFLVFENPRAAELLAQLLSADDAPSENTGAGERDAE
ncbi:MAG: hypothetical protein PHW69_00470 [Elusimicrobiaceae bacterium]|nr:hypothetical protein [Elusimicrobiaceae bacterium]